MKILLLLLACLGLGLPAQGQESLETKVAIAAQGLPRQGYIIMIADEKAWAIHKQESALGVEAETAFTVFNTHTIFIRAKAVEHESPQRLSFILRHEFGHVACHCFSETIANQWAREHIN